jgi:tetratricopeptide (TPR) repeat protein
MNPFPGPDSTTWTPSLAGRVDQVCSAFETRLKEATRTGQWPPLEDHLSQAAEPERSTLLKELLGLDLDYRRRAGEPPSVESYIARFPDHAELIRELLQAPPPPPSKPAPARAAQGPPVIPGYENLEKLGSGGMGVVYRAWQVRPGRLVALKMISSSSLVDPEELAARFHTEAEAIGRLNHPHIVQIHEMGDCGGLLYFSMEYVEGGGLDRKLTDPPWQPRAAAELVALLAGAMHAVHQRGIIHRDLKPANVLLTPEGTPKITDFGLAKLLIGGKEQTQSEAFIGTPSYMAPEQARGRAREVTPATDVYALGTILYALLTGRAPFLGETNLEVLAQVLHEEPVPPSRLRAGVPKDLEIICLKCLEKSPGRRYASAAQLGERLRLFLDGKPIPDRPPGTWERLVRSARRHPVIASLIGAGAAALLGLVLIMLWYNLRLQQDVRRGVARADIQRLLLEAQDARANRELEVALAKLRAANEQSKADASLDDLRSEAERLRARVHQELTAQKQRQAFQVRYREALRFFQDAPAAVFGARAETSPDRGKPSGLLGQMRAAVDRAETLHRDPNFRASAHSELIPACHELLLVLADEALVLTQEGSKERARAVLAQVVELLERAGQLGTPPRVYHARLAEYLARAGKEDRARSAQARARGQPASATDFFLGGLHHYRKPNRVQAIRDFEEVRLLEPRHFWALYWLARCHLERGHWGAAAEAYAYCLKQRSDLPGVYLGHGFAATRLNQLTTVEDDFRKAEALQPAPEDQYRLYVMLGGAWSWSGQREQAVKAYARAIRLHPTGHEAHLNLGQVYRVLGQWDRAVAELTKGIQLAGPQRPLVLADAHAELGRVCLKKAQGETGPARARLCRTAGAHAAEALKLSGQGNPAAYLVLAEALLTLKDHAGAVRAYSEYLKRERKGVPLDAAYIGRGLARLQLADFRGAITDYTLAIHQEQVSDPEVLLLRGWAYYFQGVWKLALEDFAEALPLTQREPPEGAASVVGCLVPTAAPLGPWLAASAFLTRRTGDAYNGRGNCLVMLGRYREALADAETAYRLVPRSPEMMHNLAYIFAQAAPRVKADQKGPRGEALAREYTARAVQRLRQALALVPPAERKDYWLSKMHRDPMLAPIYCTGEFERLEKEMNSRPDPPLDQHPGRSGEKT